MLHLALDVVRDVVDEHTLDSRRIVDDEVGRSRKASA